MSILPDDSNFGNSNPPAEAESARHFAPQSHPVPRVRPVPNARVHTLAAKWDQRLAELAELTAPDPSWNAFTRATWEKLHNKKRAAERRSVPCSPSPCCSREKIINRARAYLKCIPGAVQGDDGSGATFRVACVLVLGFGLTSEEALALMLESWNDTCQPPWSVPELQHKLDDAQEEPGPRGYLLVDRDPPSRAAAATPKYRGYDSLTPEEVELLRAADPDNFPAPPAPPEDPAEVANELNEVLAPGRYCPSVRVLSKVNTRTGVRCCNPVGCHRLDCDPCFRWKAQLLFQETAPYLIRLTDPDTTDDPRQCYATIVAGDGLKKAIKAVQKLGAKYLAIPVTDASSVAELIDPPTPEGEIRQGRENTTCLISPQAAPTLILIHLPATATAPKGYAPVSTAAALRAVAEALMMAARPKLVGVRNRFGNKSQGWGDKLEKPRSDWKVEGKPAVTLNEVREVVRELGVQIRATIDGNKHGEPAAWHTTPARSLLISLLIRGAETTFRPTTDRIIDVARDWFSVLGPELGSGPRLEDVLRSRLWVGPAIDTAAALAAANDDDQAADRFDKEAATLVRLAREMYDADPGPHRGYLSELFGPSPSLSA